MSYVFIRKTPYYDLESKLKEATIKYKNKEEYDFKVFVLYTHIYLFVDNLEIKKRLKNDYLSLFIKYYPFFINEDIIRIIDFVLEKNIIINSNMAEEFYAIGWFHIDNFVRMDLYKLIYHKKKFISSFISSSPFLPYKKLK